MSLQVRHEAPSALTYGSATGERINNDEDDNGLFTNRSVMMANFEEWIRMATDNKINSRNSWNFALIDYFYDLNVLRDSENNINFQKASATLDGCVKIYSSRVDSVSNETGKLLSGLAQRKEDDNKKRNKRDGGNNDGEVSEDEDGGGDGGGDGDESVHIDPVTGLPVGNDIDRTKRRVLNRVLETTLVEFDSIKLKELDHDFHVDPLFKKAMAEFDESGAKSLLLNTLNVDSTLKVIFDAKIKENEEHGDDFNQGGENEGREQESGEEDVSMESHDADGASKIDDGVRSSSDDAQNVTICLDDEILALGMEHIKFSEIATSEISPSIRELRNVINNGTEAKSFVESLTSKFDKFLTEEELKETIPRADESDELMDNIERGIEHSFIHDTPDVDNDPMGNEGGIDEYGNDLPDMSDSNHNADVDIDIGIGTTSMNKDGDGDTAAITRMPNRNMDNTSALNEEQSLMNSMLEEDLMAYFDDNLNKNWRGREHWKVRNFKKLMKRGNNDTKSLSKVEEASGGKMNTSEGGKNSSSKAKKELEIDFFTLDSGFEESIFAVPKKISTIELPHRLRSNKSHYLLPNDYHFTTDKITRLFIKPYQRMSLFSKGGSRKRTGTRTIAVGRKPVPEEGNELQPAGRGSQVVGIGQEGENQIANEEFWAENYRRKEQEELEERMGHNSEQEEDILVRDPENPFDDYNTDIDFNQAFADSEETNAEVSQMESTEAERGIQTGGIAGATSTTSVKREEMGSSSTQDDNGTATKKSSKLAYSRVSKKVNVKRLKDNVWSSLNELAKAKGSTADGETSIAFSEVVKGLTPRYSSEDMKDISTSFSFICLLHLANEHGFEIENCDNFEDLTIKCSM